MKFIAYTRVSTQKQGRSGLGLEAQQAAIASYLRGRGELLAEVQEVESGRKGSKGRPELEKALARCRQAGAALVIGKLDRLARDVRYFLQVIDDSGVDIRFADLPDICPASDEGRMILVSMANFAEFEGRRIGTRTKSALAAAKARGVILGAAGAANLRPHLAQRQQTADMFAGRLRHAVTDMTARGLSQRAMVIELNGMGIPAPQGGTWQRTQLRRVLDRIAA